jgi:hypothetical protein
MIYGPIDYDKNGKTPSFPLPPGYEDAKEIWIVVQDQGEAAGVTSVVVQRESTPKTEVPVGKTVQRSR